MRFRHRGRARSRQARGYALMLGSDGGCGRVHHLVRFRTTSRRGLSARNVTMGASTADARLTRAAGSFGRPSLPTNHPHRGLRCGLAEVPCGSPAWPGPASGPRRFRGSAGRGSVVRATTCPHEDRFVFRLSRGGRHRPGFSRWRGQAGRTLMARGPRPSSLRSKATRCPASRQRKPSPAIDE